MISEARKLHVIEEVLKIKNDKLLAELEAVLRKQTSANKGTLTINDFVGILSNKESVEMKRAIAETCETIDKDAWK